MHKNDLVFIKNTITLIILTRDYSIGQLVAKGKLNNDIIDISVLEAAVYQIRFTTESGVITKRFIKQ